MLSGVLLHLLVVLLHWVSRSRHSGNKVKKCRNTNLVISMVALHLSSHWLLCTMTLWSHQCHKKGIFTDPKQRKDKVVAIVVSDLKLISKLLDASRKWIFNVQQSLNTFRNMNNATRSCGVGLKQLLSYHICPQGKIPIFFTRTLCIYKRIFVLCP